MTRVLQVALLTVLVLPRGPPTMVSAALSCAPGALHVCVGRDLFRECELNPEGQLVPSESVTSCSRPTRRMRIARPSLRSHTAGVSAADAPATLVNCLAGSLPSFGGGEVLRRYSLSRP